MIDLQAKSDDEIRTLIANYRSKGATDKPAFAELLAEMARRKGQGLDFEKSLTVVRAAAREGRFVGYKQLADECGLDWSKVHWSVGPHLDQMLEYCHRRGWPLLPAIVVRQGEVATGRLDGTSLSGFIEGCKALGIDVEDDHAAYAAREQKRVFEWAKEGGA